MDAPAAPEADVRHVLIPSSSGRGFRGTRTHTTLRSRNFTVLIPSSSGRGFRGGAAANDRVRTVRLNPFFVREGIQRSWKRGVLNRLTAVLIPSSSGRGFRARCTPYLRRIFVQHVLIPSSSGRGFRERVGRARLAHRRPRLNPFFVREGIQRPLPNGRQRWITAS